MCRCCSVGSTLIGRADTGWVLSHPPELNLGPTRLLADAQTADQLRVPIGVLPLQVIEQAPALPDQLEKAAARVVVLRVGLEMFGEVIDALAEEGNLHLGGSGVGRMGLIGSDDF